MITWKYDLSTLTDPIPRLGLHGLWRLLVTEGDELYPLVKQSDRLRWKITNTTLEITFGTLDDLKPLLHGMVGSLPDGVIIPPGYPRDPQSKRFYVTGMAHSAIASLFSAGASTPRRTKATKKRVSFDLYTYTDWTTKQEKTATRSVSIHTTGPGKPLSFKEVVKGKVSMNAAFHPSYSQWNKKGVRLPTQEAFLTAFCCLGYTYALCNEGYFGLGIDRPSFTEADLHHRMNHGDSSNPSLTRLYGIDAGFDVAAVALAIHVDLPDDRPYHVLAPTGDRYLNWTADSDTFKYAVGASTSILGRREEQTHISSIPLRIFKKGEDSKIRITVLDQVFLNVQAGRPWYADLRDLVTCSEFQDRREMYASRLTHFTRQMEATKPMEKKLRLQMHSLYVAAALALGSKDNPNWEKANAEVILSRLQSAVTPMLIRRAIWEVILLVQRKSDSSKSPLFTMDVQDYLNERLKKDPVDVQSLLIFSCMTYGEKKKDDTASKDEVKYVKRPDGSFVPVE